MTKPVFRSSEGERAVLSEYDRLLEKWLVPCEGLRLPTRHGETFAIASGDPARQPLVLLHPAGMNSAFFGEEMAKLSRHFRAYAIDIPGEPGKSAQSRLVLDGPASGDWLADALDVLKLAKVSVLGYSQGGAVALRFAVDRPERVEKLVLVAPGGIAQPRISLLFKVLPLALLGNLGRRWSRRVILGRQKLPVALDEYLNLIMKHFAPSMGREYIFLDAELQRLTMPVLLLTGSQDAVRNSLKMAERMRSLLPRCEHRDFPGMGHLLPGFAESALPFLADFASAA